MHFCSPSGIFFFVNSGILFFKCEYCKDHEARAIEGQSRDERQLKARKQDIDHSDRENEGNGTKGFCGRGGKKGS